MKKLLLSMVALATMGLAAMAQTYSVEPAANTVLPKAYSNWASMSLNFNFDQAVSVGDVTSVKLMKGDPTPGTEVTPDDEWYSTTSNGGKTVTLWGADYDGYTCTFECDDANYYLELAAQAARHPLDGGQLQLLRVGVDILCRVHDDVAAQCQRVFHKPDPSSPMRDRAHTAAVMPS